MHHTIKAALGIGLLSAVAGLGGCFGYASYPPIAGASPAINNPNAPPVDDLMILATRWVADRYPPPHTGPVIAGEPQFAINLPEGVRRDVYEHVSDRTNGRAVPLTEENAKTLPVYHIARVWVRMRDAKVDILRPRLELPRKADGQPVYECVTLLCEGGLQPWRVARFQTWEVGVVDTPPLYYCPSDYGDLILPSTTPNRAVRQAEVPQERPVDMSAEPAPQAPQAVEELPIPVVDDGTGDGY